MLQFTHIVTLALTFGASLLMTYAVIRFSKHVIPTHRCSHDNPTPTSGGISFIITFLFYSLFLYYSNSLHSSAITYLPHFFLGATLLALIGLYDDIYLLSYRIRLGVQVLCAILIILGTGVIEIPIISVSSDSVTIFKQILTLVIFLCIINGSNFIDGLNGLLSINMLICILFAPLWVNFQPTLTLMYVHLAAGLLGFIAFNFPKGRVFMGDIGSTFLGYTLVFFALISQQHYHTTATIQTALFNKGFIFTLLPLSFIWFDVAFTLFRRAIRGNRLTEAHRDHMIHVLKDQGKSHAFVTLLYACCTAFMGCLTYLCHKEIISFIALLCIYTPLQILFVLFVFYMQGKHSQRNEQQINRHTPPYTQ